MRPSVCYVASYDPDYPRNIDVIRALRAAGARVEVVRGPGRLAGFRGSRFRLLWTAVLLVPAALVTFIDVALRLLRCQVLVVGYFGQVDMLLFGLLAKSLHRPVIFNPLVTLTDTLIDDRRLVPRHSPLAVALRLLDRLALRLADLVLVDTPENAVYAARLAGMDASRLLVLPVGADETVFYPAADMAQRAAGELDVLYYGKFIPLHGVETIVRAAALLEARQPGIRFELVGTGQAYAATRELARELGLTNIRWTDWLPYSGLGERLREADVALGIFDGGEKAARVIPNKVHQALACGVPVVTRTSPAVARVLEDRRSALLVPPDDPEALAAVLTELAQSVEGGRAIGSAGREAWERYASAEQLTALAGEALKRVGVNA